MNKDGGKHDTIINVANGVAITSNGTLPQKGSNSCHDHHRDHGFDYDYNHHRQSTDKTLIPEYRKTIFAYVYMNAVSFVMCYAVCVAQDHAPDRNRHPPLPDVVLDSMPHIPWGVRGSEMCTTLLVVVALIVCLFHKHRMIVLRRFFTILGTIYIFRIVTILCTALPVLPSPQDCTSETFDGTWKKLRVAFAIWMQAGSRMSGIKMCGDYMFSGHVTTMTLLNLFIIEYSSNPLGLLHVSCCFVNLLGSYLIIVGNGHYTVDVIVAAIIVFALHQYYHALTHLYVQTKRFDSVRWFPLFRCFEKNVCQVVPNEFEIPKCLLFSNVTFLRGYEST